MMFVAVFAALIGFVGGLLWFTGWAEESITPDEVPRAEAKTR